MKKRNEQRYGLFMADDGEIISMMVIIVFISCHETNNNDNNKVTVCVSLNSVSRVMVGFTRWVVPIRLGGRGKSALGRESTYH